MAPILHRKNLNDSIAEMIFSRVLFSVDILPVPTRRILNFFSLDTVSHDDVDFGQYGR